MEAVAKFGPSNRVKKIQALCRQHTRTGNTASLAGDHATMNYGGYEGEANTAPEVAALISKYTYEVSKDHTDHPSFDNEFRSMVTNKLHDLKIRADDGNTGEQQLQGDAPPTQRDVEMAVKDARRKLFKSAGPDAVTNWMIVWGGQPAIDILHALYGAVWASDVVPSQWTHAHITYLYKGKGSKREISNYRPISLTSIIGKLMTKSLLPTLNDIIQPHLVLPQGCGKKGEGSMEHLWALLSLTRENMDAGKCVHAFFADVHKAYDQVWREALYYGLYAMGVRGRLWRFVQQWLDSATATPKWNGTEGAVTALEQGLRQGCVLSPILYCAFINLLVMEQPTTANDLPPNHQPVLSRFFNQGVQPMMRNRIVQHMHSDVGLTSAHLREKIPCMLFMDDTTLLATSEDGLTKLIRAYTNFCNKFRMQINRGKSKIMTFSKRPVQQRSLEIDGATYEPPSNGQQKYLGYVCEPSLKGMAHTQGSIHKAKAKLAVSASVSKRLGHDIGHMYANTHVMPHALYANEVVLDTQLTCKLDALQNKLTGQVYGVGKHQQWWTHEPPLCLKSMAWHRPHEPWSIEVKKRASGVFAKLAANAAKPTKSLSAQLLAGQQAHGFRDPFLEMGLSTCEKWRLRQRMPKGNGAVKRWKKRRARGARDERRQLREEYTNDATNARPSDVMMRITPSHCSDEATEWRRIMDRTDAAEWQPVQRVADVIKVKLGSFVNTRVAISRRAGPSWGRVPDDMKVQLLRCPCGEGQQDAYHLWRECSQTERVMEEACALIVQKWPEAAQLPGWAPSSVRERVRRVLAVDEWRDTDDQCRLKGRAASIITGAMGMHNADLELDNHGLQRCIKIYGRSMAGTRQDSDAVHTGACGVIIPPSRAFVAVPH